MKFAVLALLASVVAPTEVVTIQPFQVQNLMSSVTVKHLITQSVIDAHSVIIDPIMHGEFPHDVDHVTGSKIVVTQCSDDKSVFTLDASKTTVTPNPPVKGGNVVVHVEGALTKPTTINDLHIVVKWNGIKLTTQDEKKTISFKDAVSYDLSYAVPSIAPNGKYVINVTGIDSTDGKTDFCANAKFSF